MKVIHPSKILDHHPFLARYTVTTEGQIFSKRDAGRFMVQRPHTNGFLYVDLSDANRGVWRCFVHVLVALQHVPRPHQSHGLTAKHVNGRTHDNRAVNLIWEGAGDRRQPFCTACGRPFDHPSASGPDAAAALKIVA